MFIIDPMESITGWAASGAAGGVAITANHAWGTQAVEFDKTGTGTTAGGIEKTIDYDLHLWTPDDHACMLVYVSDASAVTGIYLILGTDGSNYAYWQWLGSALTAGRFTLLSAKLGDAYVLAAGMDLKSVVYASVMIVLDGAGDTLANIAIDQIYLRRASFTQS